MTKSCHDLEEGDLVRVTFVREHKARPFFEGKIAVVEACYGFRCFVRRITATGIPGFGREVEWPHILPVDDDELTEKEWAQVVAWRLTCAPTK